MLWFCYHAATLLTIKSAKMALQRLVTAILLEVVVGRRDEAQDLVPEAPADSGNIIYKPYIITKHTYN